MKLAIAVLVVVLPLAWIAQPLMVEGGNQSASLRFERELEDFGRAEAELVRKQAEILTFPPNARVNRLEIAQRLRKEVLEPWRAASRPLLQSNTLEQDGSRAARRQAAIRDYLRARERALELQSMALDTGDPDDQKLAVAADARVGETLKRLNEL